MNNAYVPNRDVDLALKVLILAADLSNLRDEMNDRTNPRDRAVMADIDTARQQMVEAAREILTGQKEEP
jgi:capsule polysaccharide export protein KpsE/RkpR